MSDNFDSKVCNELQSTKNYSGVKFKYTIRYYIFTVGQPITKQCLILFSMWCKKFPLAIKEKTLRLAAH